MTQTAIPYIMMRGGSSKGPYFNRSHLPQDREQLSNVLISALGSGHPINIDGIGGGVAVATKVAMLSPSDHEWADVDYFFAQVSVDDQLVDYKPTCGNILAGVGPAAIEMGIIPISGDVTEVKIRAVNTNALVTAQVQTPNDVVQYEGEEEIAGVPGGAAPILLKFQDVAGSVTGALLPTGNLIDEIDGIKVTFMDAAMPLVIARAESFGLSGYETVAELEANRPFFDRMEAIRIKAGEMIGMENVSTSVTPKFGLVSSARSGGHMNVRYFMPWNPHPSLAVTGAQCLAACALTPGSIADGLVEPRNENPITLSLEHPSGLIDVVVDYSYENGFTLNSAGLVRTARKLADGNLYVPDTIWDGRLDNV